MFKRIPDIVVWPGKLNYFFLLASQLFMNSCAFLSWGSYLLFIDFTRL